MSALSDLMANVIEPGGIMPGRNYLRLKLNPPGNRFELPPEAPNTSSPLFLGNQPNVPLPPVRPNDASGGANVPLPPPRPDGGNYDLGGGYFVTPEGDVTAPGQKAMPTSTGVQTSPPATGNLPPGVIQYDVPGAGYRPGRGPLITAAQLGKWFGG